MTDREKITAVAALYRFVTLDDYGDLKSPLLRRMMELDIKGTLLLAHEGINGTVAGCERNIDALIDWMKTADIWNERLTSLDVKKSYTTGAPFARCKVKLKNEIVTMGITDIDPTESVGTYIEPKNWNQLISDPDVVTIDTRNDYEIKVGAFKGAINPHTTTFREFPDYARRELNPNKHKKVAMYCTGGIRCEKSTAYMKSLGFEKVYHLQGGILKYLEEVPEENSLWEGECFVFDDRVAVNHQLQQGSYTQCHACRVPLDKTDVQSEHYVPGESCPHCYEQTSADQRARYRERQKQIELAKTRGEKHIGESMEAIRIQRHAEKIAAKEKQRADN